MWRGIVAQSYTPETFDAYCRKLRWRNWRPQFIVLHNTAIPTLAQRPNGFSDSAMRNLEVYYRDKQKWSAGPHLFVDDRAIWIFTPLELPGVHSPSWNACSLGVEMLGNYETEVFDSGRGLAVRRNAVAAIATLSDCLKLQSNSLRFHREDLKTTHQCPGRNVVKEQVIKEVRERILELRKERAA
jgi:hypothetical protein